MEESEQTLGREAILHETFLASEKKRSSMLSGWLTKKNKTKKTKKKSHKNNSINLHFQGLADL